MIYFFWLGPSFWYKKGRKSVKKNTSSGFSRCRYRLPLSHQPKHHRLIVSSPMSQTPFSAASSSTSNFQSIFDAALNQYKKKTKTDLLSHRLTTQLESCSSPSAILAVLDEQYHVQDFIRSQSSDGASKQWLNVTASVLFAFSGAVGEGVGLVTTFHGIEPLFASDSHSRRCSLRPR